MNNKEQAIADNSLAWEEVSTEHIVRDEWIDFRKSAFRFPDGQIFQPYYTFSRRDYVVIVPFTEDGQILCVRQFRQGIREVTTEFPAGGIERTDGKEYGSASDQAAEEALQAARRELREETGYESEEWQHLLTVPADATISNNYAHLFLAKNCRLTSEQDLDAMEFLQVVKLSPEEIENLISSGGFKQIVHVAAWLLAKK